MKQTIRTAVCLWALLLLVVVSVCCQRDVGAGSPAPAFSLRNLSGDSVTLEQFGGRLVLLDFWATWCPPCRQAIPELVNLHEKYEDRGLAIVGISMDDPRMASDEYLRIFKEKMNINYTILRADERTVRAYFPDGRTAIPTLYIIDQEGVIQGKVVGYQPGVVERAVVELLQ